MSFLKALFGKYDFYEKAILDIADIISHGDKDIAKELRSCVSDAKRYASKHKVQYKNRGIDIFDTDIHTLMWLGMADCLIKHGYAQEFDWKCEKDDFVAFMSKLKSVQELGCEINSVLLYDDDDVAAWCAAMDKVWYTKKLCIGGIDIISDSYVLFVCSKSELDEVKSIARSIRRRIVRGREL